MYTYVQSVHSKVRSDINHDNAETLQKNLVVGAAGTPPQSARSLDEKRDSLPHPDQGASPPGQ